jgi:hypothetical protein
MLSRHLNDFKDGDKMNIEDFNKVVNERVQKMRKVLSIKAGEYSTATDRMHNFKVAAQLAKTPITPEQALWGMLRKHLVSVIDIIEDTANGIFPSEEKRDEKIGDTINYMVLLEGILIERENLKKCE